MSITTPQCLPFSFLSGTTIFFADIAIVFMYSSWLVLIKFQFFTGVYIYILPIIITQALSYQRGVDMKHKAQIEV